ncbi:hypothetical protein J2W30_005562 [Variovorax boronicumulans]|uniref:hypothetical protein n=1 Tax=Variovorax boronicumulans TaxID=436515 RepID=UPI002786D428|nr:hypothetical protein [Variovorax boronicumulans]MDQ0037783.1 hypothetical protein [Variovorax boronicumulans]
MQLATRQSPRFSTRAILAVLAIALWFAGTLGVMHRSLHVPGLPAAAAAVQVVQADSKGVHVHAGHGVVSLFGDHTDAECRLYDQLSHGSSVPGVPLVVLPMLLPSATFAYLQGEAIARWVALFDARGPPSSR